MAGGAEGGEGGEMILCLALLLVAGLAGWMSYGLWSRWTGEALLIEELEAELRRRKG
jgi:hypothetical protein